VVLSPVAPRVLLRDTHTALDQPAANTQTDRQLADSVCACWEFGSRLMRLCKQFPTLLRSTPSTTSSREWCSAPCRPWSCFALTNSWGPSLTLGSNWDGRRRGGACGTLIVTHTLPQLTPLQSVNTPCVAH
jgi:hypothetical protein